jgi:hypothetical protein
VGGCVGRGGGGGGGGGSGDYTDFKIVKNCFHLGWWTCSETTAD